MESLAFIITVSIIVSVIIIVVIIQVFSTTRARMSITREESYHKLAEESVVSNKKTTEEVEKMSAELVEIKNRLISIEKILREVE